MKTLIMPIVFCMSITYASKDYFIYDEDSSGYVVCSSKIVRTALNKLLIQNKKPLITDHMFNEIINGLYVEPSNYNDSLNYYELFRNTLSEKNACKIIPYKL